MEREENSDVELNHDMMEEEAENVEDDIVEEEAENVEDDITEEEVENVEEKKKSVKYLSGYQLFMKSASVS